MKKILSILVITLFLSVPAVQAQSAQRCKEEVGNTLSDVMGSNSTALHGALRQLSDLTSTNLQTHALVDEVEQIARDTRLELQGICNEVARFSEMNVFYVAAYDLSQCQGITANNTEVSTQLDIVNFCSTRSDELLGALLDSIRDYLLRQAVRTSMEPVVQRMQSLNARLTVLISEYSRLVNNFFTFSFRLGDTIIGERD